MGLLSWLRSGNNRNPRWEGNGNYGIEVVGESHYQDALAAICGGYCEEGHEHECIASLVPESNNPYDRNAVAVVIEGRKVAHLSRDDASDYREILAKHRLGNAAVQCAAVILGGWDRGRRGNGHFGVNLDIAQPPRLLRS